jgi:acetyltransferase-like isoleucine patch superfamily enzyme
MAPCPVTWRQRILTPLQVLITFALYLEAALLFGLAAFPGVASWQWVARQPFCQGSLRGLLLTMAAAAGYFIFGLGLLVVLPAARWLTGAFGTPVGRFRYPSLLAWRWASYNALTLMLRFSFIHWLRLTPLLNLYHRLMGMRLGARVQINTAVVSDQNLISIGDDTVIGGDVTLVAHAVERGTIVAAPIRIGARVTVGLMAVIFPGCVIGDDAVIAAGSVLSKDTRVGAGEIWVGVPARRVGSRRKPRHG